MRRPSLLPISCIIRCDMSKVLGGFSDFGAR